MSDSKRVEFEKIELGKSFRHSDLPYYKVDNSYAQAEYGPNNLCYFDGPELVAVK